MIYNCAALTLNRKEIHTYTLQLCEFDVKVSLTRLGNCFSVST